MKTGAVRPLWLGEDTPVWPEMLRYSPICSRDATSWGESDAPFPLHAFGAIDHIGGMFDTIPYDLPFDGETAHLGVPLFTATGTRAGPRLVVTGPEALMRPLADLFWDVDGLERIHGTLVLRASTQDPAFDLPDAVLPLEDGPTISQAYLRVLGHMTALCMIAGRGVPARWVA